MAACVALTVWLHRRCLTAYFAPDDLISLERARGLLPPYPVPFWRVLSGSGYFAVALRVFGTNPFPYHLVNMLVHSLNVALVFLLARHWSGRVLVATLAAGLFATSHVYATALIQVVGLEELLALAFTLLALLVFDAGRPRRVLAACGLFAMALLSKEGALLMPLVLLLPLPPAADGRRRLAGVGALLGVSIVYVGAFVATTGSFAVHQGEAYAARYGTNLFHSLMTYVTWVANFHDATPDLASGISLDAWRAALWIIGAMVALAAAAWRRPTLVVAGLAWFVLALAAVLPYVNHSYAFYLYPALPGVAIAIARSCDALLAWAGGRDRPAAGARARFVGPVGWLLVAGLIASQAWASERLNIRRWETMIPGTTLAADPGIRKSELARHVVESLAPSLRGRRTRLVFLTPPGMRTILDTRTGQILPGGDEPVPLLFLAVLDEGRALRAAYPQVDSVAFASAWSRAFVGFDIVAANGDGFATNFGQGPAAHLGLTRGMLAAGIPLSALDDLTEAIAAYPDDARLVRARALIEAAMRDSARRGP